MVRKAVTCHEDPRFAGGPHLEQLVDELSFIGGKDQGTGDTVTSQMGLRERAGVGCVSDQLTAPAESSGARLAHSRRSINICYIEVNWKPTCFYFV